MDRINILYCSYRDWGNNILSYTKHFLMEEYKNLNVDIVHVSSTNELLQKNLQEYDLLFFIGWSELIPDYIVSNNYCICLHPSPLPRYRGGSPIQNQIINGNYDSAVSFFIMDSGIDTGDILYQTPIKLEGDLSDIFAKITNISYPIICSIINDYSVDKTLKCIPQNHDHATSLKRRTKEMSEIQITDFSQYTATQLYDKIRSLQDPYPNAFIRCKDDTILYITRAKL
jgi:methionyl-tRNA formyltransferase